MLGTTGTVAATAGIANIADDCTQTSIGIHATPRTVADIEAEWSEIEELVKEKERREAAAEAKD